MGVAVWKQVIVDSKLFSANKLKAKAFEFIDSFRILSYYLDLVKYLPSVTLTCSLRVKLMYHKDAPEVKNVVKVNAKNSNQEASVRHFRQELKLKKLDHPAIIKLFDLNENGKLFLGERK